MRAALLLAVISVAACEDEGMQGDLDGGGPITRPTGGVVACPYQSNPGTPCAMAPDALCHIALTLRDCLADVKRCHCTGGRLACDPLPREYACQTGVLADGYGCASDGLPFCARAPSGGNCTCKARQWSCSYACPEGCPPEAPGDDTSCSLSPEESCPYDFDYACACSGGRWSCG